MERSKANAENLLMELQDEYMKSIMTEEKIMMKKENFLVRIIEFSCFFFLNNSFIYRCAKQKRV